MNLKTLLPTLAEYNRQANFDMIRIFKAGHADKFTAPAGSYFQSPAGILNHVYGVDLNWLRRLNDNGILTGLLGPVLAKTTFLTPPAAYFDSLAAYEPLRRDLDNLLETIMRQVPAEALDQTVRFTGWDGQPKALPLGGGLLHLFNHAVHHRGNVAQILDAYGIENDYSNLMRFFLE